MPVQNFFLWNSELFHKGVGLLRNISQNFKGIFLETVFFFFLNGTQLNSNNFHSIQSKFWPYLQNNIPKRSTYGIFDKLILTLFIHK